MTRKQRNIAVLFLKKFRLLFVLLFSLLVLFLGIYFWWQSNLTSVSLTDRETAFVIEKGESLGEIIFNLREKNLIRNPFAFKLYIVVNNLSGQLQAGYFKLSPASSVQEIADQLTHGATDAWFTFPEGWRREEYAVRLANGLPNFKADQFMALTSGLEGQLFPDTYLIPRQAGAVEVIEILRNNFDKKVGQELLDQARDQGLTKNELLTLASLVEREVRDEADRVLVAGIIKKRLTNDWPLQIDATLQYAKTSRSCRDRLDCEWWPVVLSADKQLDSPFNTYQKKGLPPQPICNPSLSAIKASIWSKESDYWFYLSDGQGKTHFGRSAEEHALNIRKYL